MRHEHERGAVAEVKTLADLRLMPMLADAVGLEVSEQLGERESEIRLLACTGDATLGVADDRLAAIDEVHERAEREKYRRRIAARVGDEACFLQLAVAPFGQTIDRFL